MATDGLCWEDSEAGAPVMDWTLPVFLGHNERPHWAATLGVTSLQSGEDRIQASSIFKVYMTLSFLC